MPSLHVLRRVKPQKKAVKNSTIIGILFTLLFLFPEYPKRLIYPFLFGEKTSEKLEISQDGSYEDVNPNIFNFTRNNNAAIPHFPSISVGIFYFTVPVFWCGNSK